MDSLSRKVKQRIESIPKGTIITLEDFGELPNKRAVALSLSRLQRRGSIERLGKGKYYVPRETKFGILGPSESAIIKEILRGDESSYISGVAVYNKLGLTAQVPSEITIVGKRYNRRVSIGNIKVKYVKRRSPVTKKGDIYILQILDAVSDIKKIPGTPINEALKILKTRIQELSLSEKKNMIGLSLYYRFYVRAVVGGILEEMGVEEVGDLRSSMNPLTNFDLGISEEVLPLKRNWNLI